MISIYTVYNDTINMYNIVHNDIIIITIIIVFDIQNMSISKHGTMLYVFQCNIQHVHTSNSIALSLSQY